MAESTKAEKQAPVAKELSLAEILAQKADWEKLVADATARERPAALEDVKGKISLFKFTAEELGLVSRNTQNTAQNSSVTGTSAIKTGATREMSKPLKSINGDAVGVWLAHPPSFLKPEGCFDAYRAGQSVDAWLVDPADEKAKENFIKKLAKYTA